MPLRLVGQEKNKNMPTGVWQRGVGMWRVGVEVREGSHIDVYSEIGDLPVKCSYELKKGAKDTLDHNPYSIPTDKYVRRRR